MAGGSGGCLESLLEQLGSALRFPVTGITELQEEDVLKYLLLIDIRAFMLHIYTYKSIQSAYLKYVKETIGYEE